MKKETRNFVSNKRNTDNLFKKIGISKYADDNFKLNKNKIKKKTFKLIIYTYKKKGKRRKTKKDLKIFFPIIGYTLINLYLKKLKFTRKYLISVMIANKNFYMVSNVYE